MKWIWFIVVLFLLCTFASGSPNASHAVAWIFLAAIMSVVLGLEWIFGGNTEAFGHFFRGMLALGLIMAFIQFIFGWPLGDNHILPDGSVTETDSHGNVVHFVDKPHKPVYYGEHEAPSEWFKQYHYTGSGKDDWDKEIDIAVHPQVTTSVWVKVNGELKRGTL